MYVALDKNGNRIYADDEQRYKECFCPACGEQLTHKIGKKKRPHFAHKQKSNCFMALNKDYLSPWHIRMQSYFPKENREFRFKDENNGQVHIADVFDPKTKTVIEFQHSPIDSNEYLERTAFHLKNGRRIVWVFDESQQKVKEGCKGRLKFDDLGTPNWHFGEVSLEWIYKDRTFKWLYKPRSFLASGPTIDENHDKYSIFVYTGENELLLQRIIFEKWDFEYVTLSIRDTILCENMSVDMFFLSDKPLLYESPLKEKIEEKAQEILKRRALYQERQEIQRNNKRLEYRNSQELDLDLNKCPLCGNPIKLRTAKKGSHKGHKFYGCANYPVCKYTENYD